MLKSLIVISYLNKFQREYGQTSIEITIAAPLFLLIILGTIQAGLLFNAHQAVKLAAFKAARSLSVNLNIIPFNSCIENMKESAALSLINVSPKISNINLAFGSLFSKEKFPILKELSAMYLLKGSDPKAIIPKYLYAKIFSTVKIEIPQDISSIRRGDQIVVKVDYLYDLNVPIVGAFLYKILEKDTSGKELAANLAGLKLTKITKKVSIQSEN